MIRTAARLALIALLVGAAGAGAQRRNFSLEGGMAGLMLGPGANPSDIVSAELAFATLSRQQGQWTGFRKTADKDAVMFVPGVVNAQAWLKKQKDPERSVSWSPDRIFISCDGSYGVAYGHAAWPDGRKTNYVTIWRRQDKGGYKWMLDWGVGPTTGPAADDGIDGKIADCPARRRPGADEVASRSEMRRMSKPEKLPIVRIADPPPASGNGQSVDGSLRWQWTTKPDGARALKVIVRYEGKDVDFIDSSLAGS